MTDLQLIMRTPRDGATTAASRPGCAPDFTKGIRAAEKAYARSGQMLDAALAYADHGVRVFPVNPRSKNPIAAKLTDEDGKPIDGTGGFKRATTDRLQIEAWWPRAKFKKHSEALIGVPMGPLSGVWCLDVDTKEGGHRSEGFTAWTALQATHGKIKTRQHMTNSGGLHEIFRWSPHHRITTSPGDAPDGIDVKGEGGYIVVPPSRARIKNRLYSVARDVAPVEAPAWLLEMIGRAPDVATVIHRDPSKPLNPFQEFGIAATARVSGSGRNNQPVDIDELADAMRFVPNPNLDWEEWTAIGLALYAALGDDGFELFDAFSQKAPDLYDAKTTARRWREVRTSPPSRTGAGKLFKIAIANGWTATPKHEPSQFTGIDEARRKIADKIYKFLHPNPFQEFAGAVLSSAQAIRCETGLGKTEAAIKAIAAFVATKTEKTSNRTSKKGKAFTVTRLKERRVGFGVATHKLGSEIEQRFADHGVDAATYRGRKAIDPDGDGEQLMCLAPEKIDAAIDARQEIEKTCCRRGDNVCEFYERCAYQRQKDKVKAASVVIFASDMIFHDQPVIGNPDCLFLDEEFSSKQIGNEITISLTKLQGDEDRELARLAMTLLQQNHNGPLLLKHARDIVDAHLLRVRLLNEMPRLELDPRMSGYAMRKTMRRNKKLIDRAVLFRNLADILPDIEAMWTNDIEVSGRLFLSNDDDTGERVLRWQGVRKVTAQFDIPTFAMDATLPPLDILRISHPNIEQVADIRVAMPPSVRIKQVIDAPTSKTKIIAGQHKERHQRDMVRYIVKRWLECERGKTLVIAQQEFETKVLKRQLPEEIGLLHFNALSGVDAFKDVRLCIIIGRTLPKSSDVESLAGILSGAKPEAADAVDDDAEDDEGDALRYERVKHGIRLRDGTGRAVRVNEHPHPLCEALRWQACEGELMQAIGRPRGINRTADTALDIDLMFDEVLPIEVDEVENWERPSPFYDTARDGVMLGSHPDMMKLWPDLFSNRSAAQRAIKDGMPELPDYVTFQYQQKGERQKWRTAKFNRLMIPEPEAWLSARLGPVTVKPAP